VLKTESLISFQCSVTLLLFQFYQRFLNTKTLNATCVRRWTVAIFLSANLSLAEWSSVGEPHGLEEIYLPCLELQTACKQCKYNSWFSAASQAQRQGSFGQPVSQTEADITGVALLSIHKKLLVKLCLAKEWPEPRGLAVILPEVLPAAVSLLVAQRYVVVRALRDPWPFVNFDGSRKEFEWPRKYPCAKTTVPAITLLFTYWERS